MTAYLCSRKNFSFCWNSLGFWSSLLTFPPTFEFGYQKLKTACSFYLRCSSSCFAFSAINFCSFTSLVINLLASSSLMWLGLIRACSKILSLMDSKEKSHTAYLDRVLISQYFSSSFSSLPNIISVSSLHISFIASSSFSICYLV